MCIDLYRYGARWLNHILMGNELSTQTPSVITPGSQSFLAASSNGAAAQLSPSKPVTQTTVKVFTKDEKPPLLKPGDIETSDTFQNFITFQKLRCIQIDNPLGYKHAKFSLGGSCGVTGDSFSADPFFAPFLFAFNKHMNCVLSPEVLWIKVLQGVALHVALNKDAFEGKFFKQHLNITVPNFAELHDQESVNIFLEGVMGEIYTHAVAKEVITALVKPFSESSAIATSVFQIGVMDVVKNFATFSNATACGIPNIVLLGTPTDWAEFNRRLTVLGDSLHMRWWVDYLIPVINKIQRTAEVVLSGGQNPEPVFWQNMMANSSSSGSAIINGWMVLFKCYIPHEGKYYPIPEYIQTIQSDRRQYSVIDGIHHVPWNMQQYQGKKLSGKVPFFETFTSNGVQKKEKRYIVYGVIGLLVNDALDTICPAMGYFIVDS